MRITKLQLYAMFKRFLIALGVESDKGQWSGWNLEHIACYGGYLIIKRCQIGGEEHPFGSARLNAREMYFALNIAIEALELKKQKQYEIK